MCSKPPRLKLTMFNSIPKTVWSNPEESSQSIHTELTMEAAEALAGIVSILEVPGPCIPSTAPPCALEKVAPANPWSTGRSNTVPLAMAASRYFRGTPGVHVEVAH